MVLHSSNFSKRGDTENRPISPKPPKSAPSSIYKGIIHSSASRRRAGPRSSKHAVEEAKRRREVKNASVRIQVNRSSPGSSGENAPQAGAATAATSFSFPRFLARPEAREVPQDRVAAIRVELADIPVEYVRDALPQYGLDMLAVLSGIKATPALDEDGRLPKEVTITVNNVSSDMPTHMLAVYSREGPAEGPRRITMFPVHSIVMAAHCANLPPLPPSPIRPIPTEGSQITVPVVPLCIPSAERFFALSAYLYTRRGGQLLAGLLPAFTPAPAVRSRSALVGTLARQLARTYTVPVLVQHVTAAGGFYRNVCALGVHDEQMWGALDLAWEVLLSALAVATGNPAAMDVQMN